MAAGLVRGTGVDDLTFDCFSAEPAKDHRTEMTHENDRGVRSRRYDHVLGTPMSDDRSRSHSSSHEKSGCS